MGSMPSEVVVIGGGVVGVSLAYYLVRKGLRVTLVEQARVGSGCSRGNAGQITPGHFPVPHVPQLFRRLPALLKARSPLHVEPAILTRRWRWFLRWTRAMSPGHLRETTSLLGRIGLLSLQLFEELAQQLAFGYQRRGRLEIAATEESFCHLKREAKLLGQIGFRYEVLSGPEIRSWERCVAGDMAGGIYYPESAHCDPYRFVMELAALARQHGLQVLEQTRVDDLLVHHHRAVAARAGHRWLSAEHFVLATGPWSPKLAKRVALELPIELAKGYHVDLSLPAGRGPEHPLVLTEERLFVTPLEDRLRLAGRLEFRGFNLELDRVALELLRKGATRYLPIRDSTVLDEWTHVRPMSPDGLPFVGPVPWCPNLWIAAGHGMLGLTQAPATGFLLAEWLTGEPLNWDLSPLRPERFRAWPGDASSRRWGKNTPGPLPASCVPPHGGAAGS
jgi:D-amino-acid dehydrogenase